MRTQWRHRIAAPALIAILCFATPTIVSAQDRSSEDYWGTESSLDLQADGLWIDGITHKILFAAAPEGTIKVYTAQIDRVRSAYRNGDDGATRTAMNSLMLMFEKRDHGIPAKTADGLFEYCTVVTPGRYHDVSRLNRPNRGRDTSPGVDELANGDGGYSG